MSDDAAPVHVQIAEAIVADKGTTFSTILRHGPLVLHHIAEEHPQWFSMLRTQHTEWVRQGRPTSWTPTVPVLPEPPRPAPAPEPVVSAPDPASVSTMRDLTRLGASKFNAFRTAHPERFDELARAAGVPSSRQ